MIERYQTKEMQRIWEDDARFNYWLKVELAACKATCEEGRIPKEALKKIEERASFDIDYINEIEKITNHDMIAFVSVVAESIGEEGRYVHLGLTSSDVIDTAGFLQILDALELLIEGAGELNAQIFELAKKYKMTPCAGRTHGIHAEPTTFGLKMLGHCAQIARDIERLTTVKERSRVGKISGAVGTYANCPPSVERRVCELLGLAPDMVSTQIIQRDRHADIINTIAIMGGSLERLATEIRHLQRTEVLEALEPFGKGQKGSSAMPHKKNPILCERVCGMARLLRGYAAIALENIALWHERDISHSSAERVIWPDAFNLAHYMLKTMTKIARDLVVQPDMMQHNMNLTGGLLYSGRVLIELIERLGVSREEAYAVVQENAMRSWQDKTPLLNLLQADERLKNIPQAQLKELFELDFFTKHVEEIFGRFTNAMPNN